MGFVAGQAQLKTDPKKIKAILDYPRPTDVSAVRTFLGMTTYFRRFIEKFAGLTVPLTNLLKKDAVGAHMPWDDSHEQAFQELKAFTLSFGTFSHCSKGWPGCSSYTD